ncbi:hypothetical protein RRG08_018257 [Elysia crispata]|uniref:Uncharacterized protein n=1 Tax=Elysia crispata TaxID=231223 RepID=A0AAE0Z3T6_9GAST|nr:hypothetical protein RRG08_018257 [Elysia crispata]
MVLIISGLLNSASSGKISRSIFLPPRLSISTKCVQRRINPVGWRPCLSIRCSLSNHLREMLESLRDDVIVTETVAGEQGGMMYELRMRRGSLSEVFDYAAVITRKRVLGEMKGIRYNYGKYDFVFPQFIENGIRHGHKLTAEDVPRNLIQPENTRERDVHKKRAN